MTTLEPGQSTECFGMYQVTDADASFGRVTNIAQAGGVDSRGDMFVSEFATATFPVKMGPGHKPCHRPVTSPATALSQAEVMRVIGRDGMRRL
jgi:hypothetical protein